MDERAIKRLLVIVAISIIAIMLFKTMMTRTIVTLNQAAAEKRRAAARPPVALPETTPASDAAGVTKMPAASPAIEDAKPEPTVSY
jgi:hypothetical protein